MPNRGDLNLVPTQMAPEGAVGQPVGPKAPMPPRPQPVAVPTGLPYGEAAQSASAQRAVPLPGGGGLLEGSPALAAVPAAAGMAMPDLGALNRPSERPQEPITAGMDRGAGPGAAALGAPLRPSGSAVLESLAAATNSPALSALAAKARSEGS